MPSIKNELQQASYQKAREVVDPLKLTDIVDKISEFKAKIEGKPVTEFAQSEELKELIGLMTDYQFLNFLKDMVEKQ